MFRVLLGTRRQKNKSDYNIINLVIAYFVVVFEFCSVQAVVKQRKKGVSNCIIHKKSLFQKIKFIGNFLTLIEILL